MSSHRHDWATARVRIKQRMAELRLDAAGLHLKSGVSDKHVRTLLADNGRTAIPHEKTRWKLCDALRWTQDSIDRILDGKEPIEVAEPVEVSPVDRLAARVGKLESALEELQASFQVALQTGMAKSSDLRERVTRLERGTTGGGDPQST